MALRVFLSSTAVDLTHCREKVTETLLQLHQTPVAMETFTASPGTPARECRSLAASADIVVVVVAHRYGFVPDLESGGDGEKSITWLEVTAAQAARKPVLAFLVDPDARWNELKESDRINTADEGEFPEIITAVTGLRAFKNYLAAGFTYNTFTNADDLARKVATAIANHVASGHPALPAERPSRYPGAYHTLQPARQFEGRAELLGMLCEWACNPVVQNRVVALIAAGGTGKTALVHQVLTRVAPFVQGGVFVWSFYENAQVEDFLRAAAEYFDGVEVDGGDDPLRRLKHSLSGSSESRLIVLDGMEISQADDASDGPKWTIVSRQLRQLLRWLAESRNLSARALVTSRFPLVDLGDWSDGGYAQQRLDDLTPAESTRLLRRLGVRGSDLTLERLAGDYGYHALTLAVLGSYLERYWEGDPVHAPKLDYFDLPAGGVKSARLKCVLEYYADRLTLAERTVLAHMAALSHLQARRRSSSALAEITLVQIRQFLRCSDVAPREVANLSELQLRKVLAELCDAGLIFMHETPHGRRYSAHPFIGGVFRTQFGITHDEIQPRGQEQATSHFVRATAGAVPSLEGKPGEIWGDFDVSVGIGNLLEQMFECPHG